MKGSNLVAAVCGIAIVVLYGYAQRIRGYVDGVTVTTKAYEERKSKNKEES